MFRTLLATCFLLVQATAAWAACTAPSGAYGGVIPGIAFSSAGATSSAYLQMAKVDMKYTKTSSNPFGGSTFYAFYTALNTTDITVVGTVAISASSWNASNCIGSITLTGSSKPFYFISTSSGAIMMGFSPSAAGEFQWAWGRLEKL
jgi:hypothetical protein